MITQQPAFQTVQIAAIHRMTHTVDKKHDRRRTVLSETREYDSVPYWILMKPLSISTCWTFRACQMTVDNEYGRQRGNTLRQQTDGHIRKINLDNNNNNNYYYYYYLLQLGCNPVAVVMLHVYKT